MLLLSHPVLIGALGSLVAALAGGLGALLVLGRRDWSGRAGVHLFTVAGGLMLGASVVGLALPAGRLLGPRLGDDALVVGVAAGLALGGLGLRLMQGASRRLEETAKQLSPWLVLAAVALHNLPEGFAVGTALGSPEPRTGLPVFIGIAFHNFPEGLAAAVVFRALGWPARRSVGAVLLVGLAEPLAGALGAWMTSALPPLRPWIWLGTAGAMIEVVRLQILPRLRACGDRLWMPLLVAVILLVSIAGALLLG